MLRKPIFCSFTSVLIALLMVFMNKPHSWRDLNIFMMLFISSLEIIDIVILDPSITLWIAASVSAAAIYSNSVETLLANGFNAFFIKSKPAFSNGPKSLPKNPPDYPI